MFSRQLFIIILMIFGMSVHAETEENLALLERSNVYPISFAKYFP